MLKKRSDQSFKHDEDYKKQSEISNDNLQDFIDRMEENSLKLDSYKVERNVNQSKLYESLSFLINTNFKTLSIKVL